MDPGIDISKIKLCYYPDPILRKMCAPVTAFDERLRQLAERMLEMMRGHRGVGLAAPQVGLPIRLFVCNTTGEPGNDLVCVNPVLADKQDLAEAEEGCLSIPEVFVPVRRGVKVRLTAFDVAGQPYERIGQDLTARVWQHESDHLDGRLIVDYMSEAAKIANRRALKQLRDKHKRTA